jgi:hypothetical protein
VLIRNMPKCVNRIPIDELAEMLRQGASLLGSDFKDQVRAHRPSQCDVEIMARIDAVGINLSAVARDRLTCVL